jgi:hypothetical protein
MTVQIIGAKVQTMSLKFTSIKASLEDLRSWWASSGPRFVAAEWRRLVFGCVVGCILGIGIHLVWHDRIFEAAIQKRWAEAPAQKLFEGFSAYRLELSALAVVLAVSVGSWIIAAGWGYLRAWWTGITSFTFNIAVILTAAILVMPNRTMSRSLTACFVLLSNVGLELWRSVAGKKRFQHNMPKLDIPKTQLATGLTNSWQFSSSDDPITRWDQDIIGRTAVVELLAEHIYVNRTPIVALNGGLGDGKSSVLNLLRRSLKHNAITVSFSAWLPGSDETFAYDLFRDIATECKRWMYVPQLRKQALGYARKLSGSVSYLSSLKEFLPPQQSQQDEINEVRETLARIPLPIVVLLDEVDRMQREELLVLLKVLRGAASIPNVTFVCAFSEEEIKKQLGSGGASLSYGYLEKFFPVKVHLAPPNPDVVGKLLQDEILTAAKEQNWFLAVDEKKFSELFTDLWQESLSRICTNLRKAGLLLNDFIASARTIGREVNILDLIGIEAIRRFEPELYQIIRNNGVYLTYGNESWTKGPYLSDRRKEQEGAGFFSELEEQISKANDQKAMRVILKLLFPLYVEKGGMSITSFSRPTNNEIAEAQKRICDSTYFGIFVRGAVPEEMYSEVELSRFLGRLNTAKNKSDYGQIFSEELDGIPAKHAKREDFLWRVGRAMEDRIHESAAEALAYAAADHAADYAYDLLNIGEAARALNIVFEAAQKLSSTSKAQVILIEAVRRAADDTFARRLLEYTEASDRNKVLTNFKNIDPKQVRLAFINRMRERYGKDADGSKADISKGDWWAFRWWFDNSEEDAQIEKDFWRKFIGASRKKLAQALNFAFPVGFTWSEDPRPIMDKILPLDDVCKLIVELGPEQLDEVEEAAIKRFSEMLEGKWYDIRKQF